MAEKADIIECFVCEKQTLKHISEKLNVSEGTVSRTVSLYFKKPKKDVVKMSKV